MNKRLKVLCYWSKVENSWAPLVLLWKRDFKVDSMIPTSWCLTLVQPPPLERGQDLLLTNRM